MGLSLAGVAWLAMAWLMQRLQAARCPEGTFFWASNQLTTTLQIVPLLFPALGLGFLLANQAVAFLPTGFDRFSQARKPGVGPVGERRQMIRLSLMLLLLALPISLGASLCQFCLEPQGIAYQANPWSEFRESGWRDVSSVTATCRYRKGRRAGWLKQFIVTMRDGAALDVMTWPAAALSAYPAIARALHGEEFSFDASGVSRRCPEPYLDILAHRP